MTPTTNSSRWFLRERTRAQRIENDLEHVRSIVGSPTILRAIGVVAHEHHLTSKQIELVAYATTDVERTVLVTKLGVSPNTMRTRVRHLIRAFDERSLDSLGKMVLLRALDTVAVVSDSPAR